MVSVWVIPQVCGKIMSGMVGGYSVNNWLAAAAVGYTVVSTPSIADARAAMQQDPKRVVANVSDRAVADASVVSQRSPLVGSAIPVEGNARSKNIRQSGVLSTRELQHNNANAVEAWRFAMNSPQAQSLAAIQPPQVEMGSADFARIMEDAQQGRGHGRNSARSSDSAFSHNELASQRDDTKQEQEEQEIFAQQEWVAPAQVATRSLSGLDALHALFREADSAYRQQMEPTAEPVLSLMG